MRIEDITPENISNKIKIGSRELFDIRHRFIQIYKNNFEGNDNTEWEDLDRKLFMEKYKIVRAEMRQRGYPAPVITGIDIALFKLAMKRINVSKFGKISVTENYLSIGGQFLETPKETEAVEVIIQDLEENRCEDLEKSIATKIYQQTGIPAAFTYVPEGPEGEHIPVFDLVLECREKTEKAMAKKKIDIKKPEETETQVRIPVGSPCDVTATITLDKEQGITALYCGQEKRIRTYIFDKKKKAWTISMARTWIKEHKTKAGEDRTRLTKDKIGKKLTTAQRKECDAETAKIRENEKTAKFPHLFKAAKYTHKNGHPRCLVCGDDQPIGDVCGMPNKWYEKHEYDDLEAWKEEREKINFSKAKEKAFFRFVKLDKKQQIIGGVIYAPSELDSQEDYTDSAEIQKAMYNFMESYAKNTSRIKIMHKGRTYDFPILESFQPEQDITKGDNTIKAGAWWMMIKVKNKAIWDKIETGELTGFSIGGTARA
jgi:hypothetical protein